MDAISNIFKKLESNSFNVSTDTRKEISGSVFFALKGDSFDGNKFIEDALKKGATAVVTENTSLTQDNVYVVNDVLKTLQNIAARYRDTFNIPIICIGGSNGKTTSKELVRDVLKTKYKVHATSGSLNNHIGVPLSILSMKRDTEMGVFEIGANHPGEHIELLNILKPTHVVVTNNGMDHLEGFGSPEGARKSNAELYVWAKENKVTVFVNKNHKDLMDDSQKNERILYPDTQLTVSENNPLTLTFGNQKYTTRMAGRYNIENIELALVIGNNFKVEIKDALFAISEYLPTSKRSQFLDKEGVHFIVDCYNANPTSMMLSLESFLQTEIEKRGVILGDMLELGAYTDAEHKKIADFVLTQKINKIIFVGDKFKNIIDDSDKYVWFPDSESTKKWFWTQNFTGFTFLLKGSRGMKIEKIVD